MSAQGDTGRKLHPLTVSSLYPSAARPEFGIFVENRLRDLAASGEIAPRVVAPVPWFPSGHARFGRYAAFARTPLSEERHGIPVTHPRYPVLPRIGMSAQPLFLYATLRRHARRLLASGVRIDLIDAHYVYPDGVAAGLLARELGVPLVVTARGTDLNLVPRYRVPRTWIRWLISHADGLVAVCEALAEVYLELGAAPAKVRVLRNGVDLGLFRPRDRAAARRRWNIDRPCMIAVGQLIERKGVDLIIRALPLVPETALLVVGDGPLRCRLEALARELRVADRVRFAGQVPHATLPELYGLADALVLASAREGWPNVLLEAMACGTPVIAAPVWGVPEVVRAPEAGVLLAARTPDAIADGWRRLRSSAPSRAATRAYADRFGWEATTRGQLDLFREVSVVQSRP